ncbi:MAG: hypothetical protein GXO32_01795 [Crenarchaeota archaeon]|nr:hypothetical protein [Thermoproteota archaeon]
MSRRHVALALVLVLAAAVPVTVLAQGEETLIQTTSSPSANVLTSFVVSFVCTLHRYLGLLIVTIAMTALLTYGILHVFGRFISPAFLYRLFGDLTPVQVLVSGLIAATVILLVVYLILPHILGIFGMSINWSACPAS